MMTCNCSLAGSMTCKSCSVYQMYFHTDSPQVVYTYYTYPNYDSDRYELVEKKDWKIKQLKVDIERFKEDLEQNKKDVEILREIKFKLVEAITYAEKELKELEK